MSEIKQVIIIRRDLWMRRGKEIAQGAHASLNAALNEAEAEVISAWLDSGSKKIVCKVGSESELLSLRKQAQAAGLPSYLVRDAGKTEVIAGTATAIAIGPAEAKKIDVITGNLELY
ncbi:MAG: peptidyl-tRNA hydrolase Pth2 [Acidiferrobacterales bacterium]|nr:peptidyl-tRNA hydrolase Pth2 [Acidiferrobacterales bacterium]